MRLPTERASRKGGKAIAWSRCAVRQLSDGPCREGSRAAGELECTFCGECVNDSPAWICSGRGQFDGCRKDTSIAGLGGQTERFPILNSRGYMLQHAAA